MFTYWCRNAAGVKSNFRTDALLSIGTIVPEEDGSLTTIISMDMDIPMVSAGDLHDSFELERMML